MHRIILYTNDCPKCKTLKNLLDKNKVKYETFEDIDAIIGELTEIGIRELPVLKVNNEYLNFNNVIRKIKEL